MYTRNMKHEYVPKKINPRLYQKWKDENYKYKKKGYSNQKIDVEDRDKIFELKKRGFSYSSIGKLFGVSRSRIHQILSGYQSNSRKWKQIRTEVLDRDYCRCLLCDETIVEKLIVHHIDHDDRNNEFDNLITLCKKCHGKYHIKKYHNEK